MAEEAFEFCFVSVRDSRAKMGGASPLTRETKNGAPHFHGGQSTSVDMYLSHKLSRRMKPVLGPL